VSPFIPTFLHFLKKIEVYACAEISARQLFWGNLTGVKSAHLMQPRSWVLCVYGCKLLAGWAGLATETPLLVIEKSPFGLCFFAPFFFFFFFFPQFFLSGEVASL